MLTITAISTPNRIAVEGVVVRHDGPHDAVTWWSVDSKEDGCCSDAILEDYEGNRVRLTVEVVDARNAMPALLAELDALRAENELLRGAANAEHCGKGYCGSVSCGCACADCMAANGMG